ncbi:MAG: hypothetical protein NTW59_01245 [Candidatus Diapherotrites archaeon]|nr:hypothetical protein [Candidatus Diapherotrites archaeon]
MQWEALRKKYDKKNVLPWMRSFGDQCIEAIYIGSRFKPKKRKIEKIVACGMGGSGVGAGILKDLLKGELHVPFDVFNSYHLPEYVDSKTLVFVVSYSGNTEETVNCLREAKRNIAYLCLPLLVVLVKLGLVSSKNGELNEAVFLLKKSAGQLEEKAKELALRMKGKMVVIYAPEELKTVAYRFRTELNENSKQFALHHFVPEQNHNEINAYLGLTKANSEFILLRHKNEPEKIQRRFAFLHKTLRKRFNVAEVHLEGKSLLATALYAVQFAALASYYLAMLNHLDPEWIPIIKELRKEMKKK